MTEHLPQPPESQPPETSPPVRHEPTDIVIGGVLTSVVILFAILGLSLALLVWVFQRYEVDAERSDPRLSPLANPEQLPPEPRLRATPSQEYQRLREAQEAELRTSAPIDRQQKVWRIPISRAMDLLVERGLPKTQPRQLDGERPSENQGESGDAAPDSRKSPPAEDDQPAEPPREETAPDESREQPSRSSGRTPRPRERGTGRSRRNPSDPPADEGRPE